VAEEARDGGGGGGPFVGAVLANGDAHQPLDELRLNYALIQRAGLPLQVGGGGNFPGKSINKRINK
jgi:hypothetical protein